MKRKKCVFGPLQSRRLGLSLGVDLLPFKTCSMDCVYCECGATTDLTMRREEFVPTSQVIEELDAALAAGAKPDYVTFSGAGEPTLHSGIGRIIEHIKAAHPGQKLCLLTNSTTLPDPEVIREVAPVDLIVPSLDGSNQEELEKITRLAPGLTLEAIVEGIAAFRKASKAALWLEIFIVPGINSSRESALRFRELVRRIAPDKVQLNTLDRPGTEKWVAVPSREELDCLASIIGEAAPVECIGRNLPPEKTASNTAQRTVEEFSEAILDLLLRRPSTAKDVSIALAVSETVASNHLIRLERNGAVQAERGERGVFYKAVK